MPQEIKVAITGSTGHLGATVIPLLVSKGYRLRALVHQQAPSLNGAGVEMVMGSLFDIDSLNSLVSGCQVVIHCAGKISINSNRDPSVYETNVNGTKNVFNAAKNAGVSRFIHLSSIHAYHQLPADELLNEERQYCPDNAPRYDRSKRDAQQFVLEQASDRMEVVVLSPTSVVGPFDHKPSLMGQAILDLYNGKVPVLISGGFDFCDVRDVASGIVNAIEKGRNGEAYLLPGKWHSLEDLQEFILSVRGDKRRIPVLPAWTGYLGLPFTSMLAELRRKEPLYTKESIVTLIQGNKKISSVKAGNDLGYTCRPLRETIADTLSWFKQADLLS